MDAGHQVARFFKGQGWHVRLKVPGDEGCSDLTIDRGPQRYLAEIKSIAEGRADRVIPLLSQAVLQAQAYAHGESAKPLAIVYVEHASPSLLDHIKAFVEQYVPQVAAGVISGNGLHYFQGEGLDGLRSETRPRSRSGSPASVQATNLFSDLNQWMLKVLLAFDLPEDLLNAPRAQYYSGAELAAAAKVSTMSASRFLQQLRHERFLDEASGYLALTRREELLNRWRAAAMRRSPEIPARFLIRATAALQVRELLQAHPDEACLGLFAAADRLGLGHVSGVPPYVYVPKLPQFSMGQREGEWDMLVAFPQGAPDLILRQALAPQSVFRGALRRDGLMHSDVIQVWLDASNHPSRGHEQAELIYRKVLLPVIAKSH